ncbi:hypothetical protein [Chengkuizengella axinellae]|uniref:Uncharacterized protein n=1 Tax=Chengkuizengella axinellae TaxID=3064388 RepID=A0ABT9J0F3_9BACL|nr:hypothetical protein [Chengkuizengella sp. 2205SS18-9]MDP5275094.1 hypothetical protein [Chengkuizengella sp. 2205SS18-9]
MGLNKGPFVVVDTVSVLDPYGWEGSITLLLDNVIITPIPVTLLSVDVCVRQPERTQVLLDSFFQNAITISGGDGVIGVRYQLQRNDTPIAEINDEMDYADVNDGRHTNFPDFPLVDKTPNRGINKYQLKVVQLAISVPALNSIYIGSRSLKATVIPL